MVDPSDTPASSTDDSPSRRLVGRRSVLKSLAAAGAVLYSTGVAGAHPRDGRGGDGPDGPGGGPGVPGHGRGHRGFPPRGLTEWGPEVTLGNGSVRTFTTATPFGRPLYHGVLFDRDAFQGLPSADALANSGGDRFTDKYGAEGEALEIHHMWSLEFFVPIPEAWATPFTFLGLNWNPGGHPPPGVWTVPHFDVHFHMLPTDVVDAIEGPQSPAEAFPPDGYDLPERYIPEGYVRPPNPAERVITDMGEHMNDPDEPEFGDGEFTNTLIWGAWDDDEDGVATLSYVEPMITLEYFRNHSGRDRSTIAQPEVYADPGTYPTGYSVRDVPGEDAVAVTLEDFRFRRGEGGDGVHGDGDDRGERGGGHSHGGFGH